MTLPSVTGTSLSGQQISFYAERVSAPLPGVNFEGAAFNSGERQFPNMRTIEPISMTLAEDTSMSVITYLRAWKNLVIDDNGNYGLPSVYKQALMLQTFDETGAVAKTLTYQGCAPSRVDALDFDGSQTRHVQVNVAFVVDYVDPYS